MAEGPFYSVVLNSNDDFDPRKLAGVLSRALAIPQFDAITRLRQNWGMLYRTQEIGKAQELQQKLRQEGIETFILDDPRLKPVPSPEPAKKIIPEPEGLALEENGQEKILPWDNFVLVCAGQVEESVMVKRKPSEAGGAAKKFTLFAVSLATGIPISTRNTKPKEEIKKETSSNYYLDIIAKEGFESVSISGYSFDYSYLGSRKEYNTFLNFKNLVLDIAKFLPRALRNQGVKVLETGDIMKNFNYNSPDDYENEKLWLVQLAQPAQS